MILALLLINFICVFLITVYGTISSTGGGGSGDGSSSSSSNSSSSTKSSNSFGIMLY